MNTSIPHLSLNHPDAAQWNRDLLTKFQAVLEKDPAADLMSIFPDSYLLQHRAAECENVSYAASINLEAINDLRSKLRRSPEINLLSHFPKAYNRRITMATGPKVTSKEQQATETEKPDFRSRLDLATDATVIFPLSERVTSFLEHYSNITSNGHTSTSEASLVTSLKLLISNSPAIWENTIRGLVVKCSEEIVAKIVFGNRDYTEYTTMQFLAERMPNVPVPKPHGLVAFGPFRLIFMSYVPGLTLSDAWPKMSHQDKRSIQCQLDAAFRSLRTLRQEDGIALGGVCGSGAKELRVSEVGVFKNITTASQYDELQFSARNRCSATYISFLRSLLEHDYSTFARGTVFTHGDVRTDNIIVKQAPNNSGYVLSGIIDWELGGFYPEYYECTALSRTLSPADEDDWYLYLPECISPARFPTRWLVDRLFGIHIRTT